MTAAIGSEVGTLRVNKTTLGMKKGSILVTMICKEALLMERLTTFLQMGNLPSGLTQLEFQVGWLEK